MKKRLVRITNTTKNANNDKNITQIKPYHPQKYKLLFKLPKHRYLYEDPLMTS